MSNQEAEDQNRQAGGLRIEIESWVPYEQSLLWRLHRDYYQQQGLQAFLSQDVPYNVSSNPCLARQLVRLMLASLPDPLPPELPVLELGAGLGVFAYNFLLALEQEAPELAPRVCYWLSDYAAESLQELARHPAFADFCARGRLRLCLIDSEQPHLASDLAGEPISLPESGFRLVVANYVFSTLPTAVLLKQGDRWLRQSTRLDWEPLGPDPEPGQVRGFCVAIAQQLRGYRLADSVAADHPSRPLMVALQQAQDSVADALETDALPTGEFRAWLEEALAQAWAVNLGTENWQGLLGTLRELITGPLLRRESYPPDQIQAEDRFEPAEQLFASELHHQALESLTADWPLATAGYSPASLKALGELVKLTCPEGLVVFNDKAYAGPEWMRGAEPERATRHGQSLAHPVNFPLFEAVMALQGIAACRTSDPAQALHSLMIYCGSELPPALRQRFEQDFVITPGNELSHALLEGGHALMQTERIEQAARCLQRALSFRPGDGTLQYLAAVCLLNLTQYDRALALLEAPHDDLFGLFNREILLAEIHRLSGRPAEALPYYLASLRHGENSQTYYNLALCQLELDQPDEARHALLQAATLDPDDEEIEALLASLSQA